MAMMKQKTLILENLKDAGCASDFIADFMRLEETGEQGEQLIMLSKHRKRLLTQLHTEHRRIDCLDYLIHSMKKNKQ